MSEKEHNLEAENHELYKIIEKNELEIKRLKDIFIQAMTFFSTWYWKEDDQLSEYMVQILEVSGFFKVDEDDNI